MLLEAIAESPPQTKTKAASTAQKRAREEDGEDVESANGKQVKKAKYKSGQGRAPRVLKVQMRPNMEGHGEDFANAWQVSQGAYGLPFYKKLSKC